MDNSVTFSEIIGQPQLWKKIFSSLKKNETDIADFFRLLKKQNDIEVVMSGAGSSAFVAEMVAGLFQKKSNLRTTAVSTTDIVTHPSLHLNLKKPLLMISFARSGNSPESLAAVNLVNEVHPNVFHLVITCNSEGKLAKLPKSEKTKVILLPEESNDQGLAMIGSVTGMVLAALLISQIENIASLENHVNCAVAQAEIILQQKQKIESMAKLSFERIVCLGSGPLLFAAREAHLKVQELSDGQVIAKWDSYLGFRHGPKAVVNDKTLLLYFLSNDKYVFQYERDLIASIQKEQKPMASLAVSVMGEDDKASDMGSGLPVDLDIRIKTKLEPDQNDFLAIPYLLVAQLLAVYKSKNLNLNPDSPSQRGAIHRVVQGVTIYDFKV